MTVESSDDLLGMLSDWDSAIYTPPGLPHPSSKSSTISGIFESQFVEFGGVETYAPTFLCRTADLTDVAHDAQLRIESVDYKVKGNQPDGTGMTLLILERQT